MKYSGTKAFLSGVRPCVVAMILATAVIMGLSTLFNFESLGHGFQLITALFDICDFDDCSLFKQTFFKKTLTPILMILFSAVLGIVFAKLTY